MITKGLALALTRSFTIGRLPDRFRETITIPLYQERKKDYSISAAYRPIALKNTLAKLIEKILANKIIEVAEA